MNKNNSCDNAQTLKNNSCCETVRSTNCSNAFIILIVLYILLAIILGSRLY